MAEEGDPDLIAQAEEFFSKEDFDFSTVSGWDEFLAERGANGAGRDADGWHDRDFTNYNVFQIQYHVVDQATGVIAVSPLPGGISVPSGNLYVLSRNQNWEPEVHVFFIGQGMGVQSFNFPVGGPTPNGQPYWGQVRFIAVPASLPAPGGASVNRMLRMLRGLGRGMSVVGSGYRLEARIGAGAWQIADVMPQRLFEPALEEDSRPHQLGVRSSARPAYQTGWTPAGQETNALDARADDIHSGHLSE